MNKGSYVPFHIKLYKQSQQINLLGDKESLVCKNAWT